MVFKCFQDIIAWQKTQDLAVEIYKVFSESKDFSFRNHLCGTDGEIKKKLNGEVDEVSKIIRGLIRSLKTV